MRLFDTHAHLEDDRYDGDRQALIAALPENDVARCLTIGTHEGGWATTLTMAENTPWIYAALGVHPHQADLVDDGAIARLQEAICHPKVKAIGEIGLDYFYEPGQRETQLAAMEKMTAFIRKAGLPAIYHIRDAWGDFLPMMRHGNTLPHGVMHCWTGSLESARECLDAGLYISFTGSVTFKKSVNLREVAAYVPMDRLLIETDCPYLSPEPHRGGRNEPLRVRHVCQCIAETRGMPVEELAETTYQNGCRLFGIPLEDAQ